MKRLLFTLSLILVGLLAMAQDSARITKINPTWVAPEQIFEPPDTTLSKEEQQSILLDREVIKKIPKEYDDMSIGQMQSLERSITDQIRALIEQRERLIKSHAKVEVLESKNSAINLLQKDKQIVSLTIIKERLSDETGLLMSDRKRLKNYLIWSIAGISVMLLAILVILQRGKIKVQNSKILEQLHSISKKNTYLEHAARIIRHDMHSGINTYIPRGLTSLERRLTPEVITSLKLESPLKMLNEGLKHSQRVYKGVYEFTNLVKRDAVLEKESSNIGDTLHEFLAGTAYLNQVKMESLPTIEVNRSLFCTAIDNLIRNGLAYNDSDSKVVRLYMEDESTLVVEDNGRGMSQEDFDKFSQPYARKEGQEESGSGLGLNICVAILEEHGFKISCKKLTIGTKISIKIK